jgi:hypothetical protein
MRHRNRIPYPRATSLVHSGPRPRNYFFPLSSAMASAEHSVKSCRNSIHTASTSSISPTSATGTFNLTMSRPVRLVLVINRLTQQRSMGNLLSLPNFPQPAVAMLSPSTINMPLPQTFLSAPLSLKSNGRRKRRLEGGDRSWMRHDIGRRPYSLYAMTTPTACWESPWKKL